MSVVIDTLDLAPAMCCRAFFFSSLYASIMSFLKLHYRNLDNILICCHRYIKVLLLPNSVPSHNLE